MGLPDVTGNLAQWLQEAARRRVVRRAAPAEPVANAVAAAEPPRPSRRPRHLRMLLLAALAAVAFLPYLFADVHLTIYKLQKLIVFVFPGLQ